MNVKFINKEFGVKDKMNLEDLLEMSLKSVALATYLTVSGICCYRSVEFASTGDYKRAAAAGVLSALTAYCTYRRALL